MSLASFLRRGLPAALILASIQPAGAQDLQLQGPAALPPTADRPPVRQRAAGISTGDAGGVERSMLAIYRARDAQAREAAVAVVQRLADAGDLQAAFRLGRYMHLEAHPADPARALKLYRQAEKGGHAWAINNIGLMYLDGRGVRQDMQQALALFRKAAALGDPHAYRNLSDAYFEGRGVARDPRQGMDWLERCMRLGDAECYEKAAWIYYTGQHGVRQELPLALELYEKAGHLGSRHGAWSAAKMNLDGIGVPQDPRKALDQLLRLANDEYGPALNSIGSIYANGKGVPVDKAEAVAYWKRAAATGYCHSLVNLSAAHEHGWGVPQDDLQATRYIREAVECESPPQGFAVWKLATRYRLGKGIEQDCQEAAKLFLQAADLGYTAALTDAGYLHQNGCAPIKPDQKLAFSYYLRSAKLGEANGQNNVGAMLKHGFGVPAADRVKAYAWLSLAVRNGNALAKRNLAEFAPMFSASDKAAGEAHLKVIEKMILDPERVDPDVRLDDRY